MLKKIILILITVVIVLLVIKAFFKSHPTQTTTRTATITQQATLPVNQSAITHQTPNHISNQQLSQKETAILTKQPLASSPQAI